jgi:hypothetical protein
MHAGAPLQELLGNLSAYTASPEAVRKLDSGLKVISFVHPAEVRSSWSSLRSSWRETMQAVETSLKHARGGRNNA